MLLPKTTRITDQDYLDWLKTQRCLFTGQRGTIDPHHISILGRGMKNHDFRCIPLNHDDHVLLHNTGEAKFIRENAPDDVLIDAMELYAEHKIYLPWKEGQ